MKFIDLFAGLGGFHEALIRLGHECVFASEIDDELREIYIQNYPKLKGKVFGDIRKFRNLVPAHDILCAGFPCQPFSKSGSQLGLHDKIRGTLFDEIIYILEKRHPKFVILENVGNFERHDNGRTWQVIKEKLQALEYDVSGTEHFSSGGSGLISPHHFGFPHNRERFFIVAKLKKLPENPFPAINRDSITSLNDIVQSSNELTKQDRIESCLSDSQIVCIEHWNKLILSLPENKVLLPSFPIWGDEIDATYPFEDYTPYIAPIEELRECLKAFGVNGRRTREELLSMLPNYARTEEAKFPDWKIAFIRQNRSWFTQYRKYFSKTWVKTLRAFPQSFRKLEWNCKGEKRNLWCHVLQFRPSGLRVKRYSSSPALVAMTSTQIPILGPKRRFLTRVEGLRLQDFPDHHKLPASRDKAFMALGNAVHVGVVEAIAKHLIDGREK
jgi:DNA (cytosine-5)-methyltransferase 1